MSFDLTDTDRRSLLRGTLIGAAALGLTATGAAGAFAATPKGRFAAAGSADPVGAGGPEIVLLGTSGGPVPGRRFHTSTALAFADAVYVIDAGDGLAHQFAAAGLRYADLRAQFITHLHSDHMAGYYAFHQLNWVGAGFRPQPVKVFGPGRADHNAPRAKGTPGLPDIPGQPLVNPELPTPGIVETTRFHQQAAAYDINERLRDGLPEGRPGPGGTTPPLVEAHAIPVPHAVNFRNPYPRIRPIHVYEDDRVRVSATLVNHWPVFPSFAYRFETEYGTVVFSGDTSPVANLYDLAHRADILVNEVVYMPQILKDPGHALDPLTWHMLSAHTQLDDQPAIQDIPAHDGLGTLARKTEVKQLVLNHLVPGDGSVPDELWISHLRDAGYRGRIHVGYDLLRVPLPATARRS
jgi:ribonuclease BN (tRNA processing enzyme)